MAQNDQLVEIDKSGEQLTREQIEAILKFLEGQMNIMEEQKLRLALQRIIDLTNEGHPLFTRYIADDVYKDLLKSNILQEYGIEPLIYDDNKACRKFIILTKDDVVNFEAAMNQYFYEKDKLSEVSKRDMQLLGLQKEKTNPKINGINNPYDLYTITNLTKPEMEYMRQKITDELEFSTTFCINENDNITEETEQNGITPEKTYNITCLNKDKGRLIMAYCCMKSVLYNNQDCEKRKTIGEAVKEQSLDNGEKRELIDEKINSNEPFSLCEIHKVKDEFGNESPTFIKKELQVTEEGFFYFKNGENALTVRKGSLNYEDLLLKCVDDLYNPIIFTKEEIEEYKDCQNAKERKEFLSNFLKDKDYKDLLTDEEKEYIYILENDFKEKGENFYQKIGSRDFDSSSLTQEERAFYNTISKIIHELDTTNRTTQEVITKDMVQVIEEVDGITDISKVHEAVEQTITTTTTKTR